jgi:hypothetical protein
MSKMEEDNSQHNQEQEETIKDSHDVTYEQTMKKLTNQDEKIALFHKYRAYETLRTRREKLQEETDALLEDFKRRNDVINSDLIEKKLDELDNIAKELWNHYNEEEKKNNPYYNNIIEFHTAMRGDFTQTSNDRCVVNISEVVRSLHDGNILNCMSISQVLKCMYDTITATHTFDKKRDNDKSSLLTSAIYLYGPSSCGKKNLCEMFTNYYEQQQQSLVSSSQTKAASHNNLFSCVFYYNLTDDDGSTRYTTVESLENYIACTQKNLVNDTRVNKDTSICLLVVPNIDTLAHTPLVQNLFLFLHKLVTGQVNFRNYSRVRLVMTGSKLWQDVTKVVLKNIDKLAKKDEKKAVSTSSSSPIQVTMRSNNKNLERKVHHLPLTIQMKDEVDRWIPRENQLFVDLPYDDVRRTIIQKTLKPYHDYLVRKSKTRPQEDVKAMKLYQILVDRLVMWTGLSPCGATTIASYVKESDESMNRETSKSASSSS